MPLPFPYTVPTLGQSQVRQRGQLFASALQMRNSNASQITFAKTNKGNWYNLVATSASVTLAVDFMPLLRTYISALVNYETPVTNADISINSLSLAYFISTANATSITLGLTQSTITLGAGNLIATDLIAPGSLPVVFGTNMEVETVTPASPATLITDPAVLIGEAVFVTPGTSNVYVWGMILDFNISR